MPKLFSRTIALLLMASLKTRHRGYHVRHHLGDPVSDLSPHSLQDVAPVFSGPVTISSNMSSVTSIALWVSAAAVATPASVVDRDIPVQLTKANSSQALVLRSVPARLINDNSSQTVPLLDPPTVTQFSTSNMSSGSSPLLHLFAICALPLLLLFKTVITQRLVQPISKDFVKVLVTSPIVLTVLLETALFVLEISPFLQNICDVMITLWYAARSATAGFARFLAMLDTLRVGVSAPEILNKRFDREILDCLSAKYEDALDALNKSKAALHDSKEQVSALEQENSRLKGQIAQESVAMSQLDDEIQEQKRLLQHAECAAGVQAHRSDLAEERISELESAVHELEEDLRHKSLELTISIDREASIKAELLAAFAKERSSTVTLTSSQHVERALRQEVAQLKSTVEVLTKQNAAYLESRQEDQAMFAAKVSMLRTKVSTLHANLDDMRLDYEKKLAEHREYLDVVQKAEEDYHDVLISELIELRREISRLEKACFLQGCEPEPAVNALVSCEPLASQVADQASTLPDDCFMLLSGGSTLCDTPSNPSLDLDAPLDSIPSPTKAPKATHQNVDDLLKTELPSPEPAISIACSDPVTALAPQPPCDHTATPDAPSSANAPSSASAPSSESTAIQVSPVTPASTAAITNDVEHSPSVKGLAQNTPTLSGDGTVDSAHDVPPSSGAPERTSDALIDVTSTRLNIKHEEAEVYEHTPEVLETPERAVGTPLASKRLDSVGSSFKKPARPGRRSTPKQVKPGKENIRV